MIGVVTSLIKQTAGLNVEVSELQQSLLNPTSRYMIVSDIIDQAKIERANNKESKRKQCFMNGNTNSYSRILNGEKSMELLVDNNDMAVVLAILNAEKDMNAKELAAKKVEEAVEIKKTKQPIMQKKSINRMKFFLGSKQNSRSMPSMVFSVFRMIGCDNVFVVSLRRRW